MADFPGAAVCLGNVSRRDVSLIGWVSRHFGHETPAVFVPPRPYCGERTRSAAMGSGNSIYSKPLTIRVTTWHSKPL